MITVFMALFGVNFNIFYFLLIKEYSQALHNEELRLYFGIMFALHRRHHLEYPAHLWRQLPGRPAPCGLSRSPPVMTTTGYATANFDPPGWSSPG